MARGKHGAAGEHNFDASVLGGTLVGVGDHRSVFPVARNFDSGGIHASTDQGSANRDGSVHSEVGVVLVLGSSCWV